MHSPRNSPEMTCEQICVVNFEQQDLQGSSIGNDSIMIVADFDCPRTETKEFVNKSLQKHYPLSLGSSFKKQSQIASQNSDSRTRNFSDVLNAMRDTEELEEEKRYYVPVTQEVSPSKVLYCSNVPRANNEKMEEISVARKKKVNLLAKSFNTH